MNWPTNSIFFPAGVSACRSSWITRTVAGSGAFAAGWAFGESALFKAHTRTADILADTDVQLYSFNPTGLREMQDPLAARVLTRMLSNLAELSLARLERAQP